MSGVQNSGNKLINGIGKMINGFVFCLNCIGNLLEKVENVQASITQPFEAGRKACQGVFNIVFRIIEPLYIVASTSVNVVISTTNGLYKIGNIVLEKFLHILHPCGVLLAFLAVKVSTVIILVKQLAFGTSKLKSNQHCATNPELKTSRSP